MVQETLAFVGILRENQVYKTYARENMRLNQEQNTHLSSQPHFPIRLQLAYHCTSTFRFIFSFTVFKR